MNTKGSQANNVISTTAWGEALQLVHSRDLNGTEALRRFSKGCLPSTPLSATQMMIQVEHADKGKHIKDIPGNIERWEAGVLTRDRDLKEKVGSSMKATVLTSVLPAQHQKALIQQADKYE